MRVVSIIASGYTWSCPECGNENYLGAAPSQVVCSHCRAAFDVSDRQHRMVEIEAKQRTLFESGGEGRLEKSDLDGIPF